MLLVNPAAIPTGDAEIEGVVTDTISPLAQLINAEKVQVVALTLTSAQLLALFTTPQTLVPAPGPGLTLDMQSISFRLNFGTVAYTLAAGTMIAYMGPIANAVPLTGDVSAVVKAAATSDNVGIPGLATGVQTQAKSENQPITLANSSNNFAAGDGTLDVVVTYLILQM